MVRVAREDVYNAVSGEREYQDAGEGNSPGDVAQGVPEFLLALDLYVRKATKAWHKDGEAAALHVVRKVTAIGVSCMEQHGALEREGYEYDADVGEA